MVQHASAALGLIPTQFGLPSGTTRKIDDECPSKV